MRFQTNPVKLTTTKTKTKQPPPSHTSAKPCSSLP